MSEDSPKSTLACYCNNVAIDVVRAAINKGANTLSLIYDATQAGSGPCGGSCRVLLRQLITEGGADSNTALLTNVSSNIQDPQFPPEVYEAISLFNRRYYWETHEVLEGVWMYETGELKLFYQGLIQAAAALYHVLNANPRGVIRLAGESTKKLLKFAPEYRTIPLTKLLAALETFSIQAKEILGHTRTGFDYNVLPMLQVGSDMERVG